MTLTAWPIAANSGSPSYAAQNLRNTMGALLTPVASRPLGALSGRRVGGGLEVTVSAPTITVQPGAAVMDVQTPVATGAYLVSSDAVDTSLALTAANASNPRIDIVYMQVSDDPVDSSGNRSLALGYLAGTAASSPAAPSTPARSLRLCTILVPKTGGGSPVVTMDSTFTVAAGGVLPCLSTARPSSPYAGQQIFEIDTGRSQTYDGTNWNPKGTVGFATNASQQDITTVTTMASTSPTLVAGRHYRITWTISGTQITNTGTPTVKPLIAGSEIAANCRLLTGTSLAASTAAAGAVTWVVTPASTGAVTFALTAQSTASAFRIPAGGAVILVEDCGL